MMLNQRSLLQVTLMVFMGVWLLAPAAAPKRLSKPNVCELKGAVFVESVESFADYKVFVEDVEAFADLLVFKEQSRSFADRPGLWHITDVRAFADFTVAFSEVKGFADFSVYFTDFRSIAGCRK